jgi:hypothetical protein
MYQALEVFARCVGDDETAELAARHRVEEQEAGRQLQAMIPAAVRQAATGRPTSE